MEYFGVAGSGLDKRASALSLVVPMFGFTVPSSSMGQIYHSLDVKCQHGNSCYRKYM